MALGSFPAIQFIVVWPASNYSIVDHVGSTFATNEGKIQHDF
jgi:hypothetical protein